jgi:nucleoside-diphosphate-sugar epimerase
MSKRVLVTGGSGKISTALIAELLTYGYEVVNTDAGAQTGTQARGLSTD